MKIDDAARKAMAENRTWWDTSTPVHYRSRMYDVPGFLQGRIGLDRFIVDEVGDVRGKRLLHLQCHFGMDTLNWARLGADVTGFDFSHEAITTARRLARDAGIKATFVESNLYDVGHRFDGRYDVVFTSWGVLCWLPDLRPWGELISGALRPGGFFYIAETHPFAARFESEGEVRTSRDLVLRYPYFVEDGGLRFEPQKSGGPDYADPEYRHTLPTNEWPHPLSEILGVLLDAGLQIELFRERPEIVWRMFSGMVRSDDGYWRLPDGVTRIPLSFSLKARKPKGRPATRRLTPAASRRAPSRR
jgi:2-polyprenyl-3-methyl-5-hydroxy-6-metoxy-1,4-benzoquinol methylase